MKRAFWVAISVGLLQAAHVFGQAQPRVEHGSPSELRGVTQVALDTGTDLQLRDRVKTALLAEFPDLLVTDTIDAGVVVINYSEFPSNASALVFKNVPFGSDNAVRILMEASFPDVGSALSLFMRQFSKAFRQANPDATEMLYAAARKRRERTLGPIDLPSRIDLSRWVIVYSDPKIMVSLNSSRIEKTESGYRVWLRSDFAEPQKLGNTSYDSDLDLNELQCASLRVRLLTNVGYLGKVVVITLPPETAPQPWREVVPDTIEEIALTTVCKMLKTPSALAEALQAQNRISPPVPAPTAIKAQHQQPPVVLVDETSLAMMSSQIAVGWTPEQVRNLAGPPHATAGTQNGLKWIYHTVRGDLAVYFADNRVASVAHP